MGFNYRKFERNASIGTLVQLGCSREVLKHAACRYGIASAQPGERREGLRQSRISHKQLKAKVKAAQSLSGFLGRLAQDSRLVAANEIPQHDILQWRKDLEDAAEWLETVAPFRPDVKEAALALALHVEGATGQRHLTELVSLLNAALVAAGLQPDLTAEALAQQIRRANSQRAEEMLRDWELLAPSATPKKK